MKTIRKILALLVAAILLAGGFSVFSHQTAEADEFLTFDGSIDSGPEFDVYEIELGVGEGAHVELYCLPPDTLDTIVQVFDPLGNLIGYNDDGGPYSCGGYRSSRLSFEVTGPGIYRIQVDGFGSSTGPYRLEITIGFPDQDSDGVPNAFDNCREDANSDQANTFGGKEGDACDRDRYGANGVAVFQQVDGIITVYGDCTGNHCKLLAAFDPRNLGDLEVLTYEEFHRESALWFVRVYYLGPSSDGSGARVYQVNVLNDGNLVDDHYVVFVATNGTVTHLVK